MSSSRIRIVGVVGLLAVLAGVFWWLGREQAAPAPGDEPMAPAPIMWTAAADTPSADHAPTASSADVVAATPEPETAQAEDAHERELEQIEAAVVTYSVEALPTLAVYLTHSEAAVREAAREGFLQMGLTEGAAHLRAAADKVRDPREAVQLLDAADFLDLPTVPVTGGRKLLPVSPKTQERLARERAAAAGAEARR